LCCWLQPTGLAEALALCSNSGKSDANYSSCEGYCVLSSACMAVHGSNLLL
jgi:hypothetical protein